MCKILVYTLGFLMLFIQSCETQNPEHLPEFQNREVEKNILHAFFPRQHGNWYATSGNSKSIDPQCPEVNYWDKYITIRYNISGNITPESIAVLHVYMEKKVNVFDNEEAYSWKPVLDKYFLPAGSNTIRINNAFPEGEYMLWYGFFLKKDSLEEYPRLHKQVCHFRID